ncbi:MAG: hypothetical protein N2691_02090 [Patescibacteria group bacterium]|nr:hypothetical protein [Patescibacteria group bacterium]
MCEHQSISELSLAHQRAIDCIQIIPKEKLEQIEADSDSSPPTIQGTGDTLLTASTAETGAPEFELYYAVATNRIAIQARELLLKGVSRKQLLEMRSELARFQRHSLALYLGETELRLPRSTQDVMEMEVNNYATLVNMVNRAIMLQIRDLATTDSEPDITVRALDLAHMYLEMEEKNLAVERRILQEEVRISVHRDVMWQARTYACNGFMNSPGWHNLSDNDRESFLKLSEHDRAFLLGLELKAQQAGMARDRIKLVSVHDIDANIKDAEIGPSKPGNAIGTRIDKLDRITDIHPRQRLQLTDSSQVDPDPQIAEVCNAMYVRSGLRDSVIFKDARNFAERCCRAQLPFYLLTANMYLFGKGTAMGLGFDHADVQGMHHNSYASQGKPHRLMEIALEHLDYSIFLFVDDQDRRSCEAIARGSIFEAVHLPLQEVYFFCARVQGEGEQGGHRFAERLAEKNIAFGQNRRESREDGLYGYQGANRLLDLYTAWQEGKFKYLTLLCS